jgi:hypothetical protein
METDKIDKKWHTEDDGKEETRWTGIDKEEIEEDNTPAEEDEQKDDET